MVSGTVGPAGRQWLEAPGRTSKFLFALILLSSSIWKHVGTQIVAVDMFVFIIKSKFGLRAASCR